MPELADHAPTATPPAAGDEGYFPRGRSLLRRVHGERAVGLIYGQRALLIGALNPLNYVGTALNTRAPGRPFARLAHTGKVFETIFFGSRAEADQALAHVHTLHETVRGTLPERAGPHPAGTPYSAYDPALMLWTLAIQADSAYALYETLVRRLSDSEREALWQEYLLFGELFGLARSDAPAGYAAFRSYWQERMSSDELHLTPGAREAGLETAFHIPVPGRLRPGMAVTNLLLLGTVPQRVRDLYDLRWTAAHQAAFQTIAAGLRSARPLVPHGVRRGGNVPIFNLVAKTEGIRIRKGQQRWRVSA